LISLVIILRAHRPRTVFRDSAINAVLFQTYLSAVSDLPLSSFRPTSKHFQAYLSTVSGLPLSSFRPTSAFSGLSLSSFRPISAVSGLPLSSFRPTSQ